MMNRDVLATFALALASTSACGKEVESSSGMTTEDAMADAAVIDAGADGSCPDFVGA